MPKNFASKFQTRRTVRLSQTDEAHLKSQADLAGISVAEYMRRKLLGGQIIAHVDLATIRELRRLGGLLKNNFDALRIAQAPQSLFQDQEKLLQKLAETIDEISNR